MKKSVCVVIPFFNTPMWGQTSLWTLLESLKNQRDKYDIEIMVVDNVPKEGGRSLKKGFINALTRVPEFNVEGIRIFENPEEVKFHGSALDTGVRQSNADYLLCWETDIISFRPDFLDWMFMQLRDDRYMVGYEWLAQDGGRDHIPWYVMPNPGLYRMDILKEINAEVEADKSDIHYWGENYSQQDHIPVARNGVFSERRGFPQVSDKCPDGKGRMARPNAQYYENGQWLFYRLMRDEREFTYGVLPVERMMKNYKGQMAPECAKFDDYFSHYWAGTRCYDFYIHPEQNRSQINYVQEKIQFEIDMWRKYVPRSIREIAVEVFKECRNDEWEYKNLSWLWDNERNQTACVTAEWFKTLFLDTNYEGLL